jgi:GGDEF domain-containing protein
VSRWATRTPAGAGATGSAPRYDLDMDSMSLVKAVPGGRHGTVYRRRPLRRRGRGCRPAPPPASSSSSHKEEPTPTPGGPTPRAPRFDRLTGALADAEFATLDRDARLAMIDIIGFHERVNVPLGYETGDHVLKVVAERLRRLVAPQRIFRVGGGKFLVEIVEPIDEAGARECARRIGAVLSVAVQIGFVLDPVGDDWRLATTKAKWAVHDTRLTRRRVAMPKWRDPLRRPERRALPASASGSAHR